jgi:hypothetical protein
MVDRMQRHFDATTGRIGFPAAPLEEGDFTEWLSTGCHPAREATSPPSLPCVGATVFYGDELERLFKTVLVPSGQSVSAASARDVFVSYSSGDFAQASAICDHLERRGVTCWIAPRDIDRGVLSYPEAIQDGIAHARAILVVLSATANLSVHMPREVDLALEGRLVIVPVRLDDVEPQGQLKYLLRTVQRTDMRPHTFSQSMEIILTRLQHATA